MPIGRARPRLGSGCLLHRQVKRGQSLMTKDDVLFGYRQQLFAEAARATVTAACRTFGCIA